MPRLRLDSQDPNYRMYCPNDDCWKARSKFRLSGEEVEVVSAASTIPLIRKTDGTHQEFKQGEIESVTCVQCNTAYGPGDALSTV